MQDDANLCRAVTRIVTGLAWLCVAGGSVSLIAPHWLELMSWVSPLLVWLLFLILVWMMWPLIGTIRRLIAQAPLGGQAIGVLILLVCALLAPVDVYEPSFNAPGTNSKLFAGHYLDTPEAGAHAARADLQRGIRRIMVYGLVITTSPFFSEMKNHGYEILFGGCGIGGPGFKFWQGYNSEMVPDACVSICEERKAGLSVKRKWPSFLTKSHNHGASRSGPA